MVKKFYCPDCERETSFESVDDDNTEDWDAEYECIVCGLIFELEDLKELE